MKTCRIIFTILCAVCLGALPLVGIFGGMEWVVLPLLFAGVFFMLMLVCKNRQLQQEEKANPTPKADYFTPLPSQPDSETPTEQNTSIETSEEKNG